MKRRAAALAVGVVALLASAAPASVQTGDTITVCHYTRDPARPYQQLVISLDEPSPHFEHEEDLVPAPPGGCPARVESVDAEPLTLCHATGDPGHPYDTLVVAVDDLEGHDEHRDDVVPAPADGCPGDEEAAGPGPLGRSAGCRSPACGCG